MPVAKPFFIVPDWPVPARVKAIATTRIGGVSKPPFDSFNLGIRTGDDEASVRRNRQRLQRYAQLPTRPCWLHQIHSTRVVDAAVTGPETSADAAWTDRAGVVCAALAADCLPVLFAGGDGDCVAVAHAGWRGLLNGILEEVVAALPVPVERLLAWLGPAIGPLAFVVGDDVRDAWLAMDARFAAWFTAGPVAGKWLADLAGLARARLQRLGIRAVFGGTHCTFRERDIFYSYRRDGTRSGRMASLIWIEPPGRC